LHNIFSSFKIFVLSREELDAAIGQGALASYGISHLAAV
jgi:hypothetical protein